MTLAAGIAGALLLLWMASAWRIWSSQELLIFPDHGAPFDAAYPQLERLGGRRMRAEREGQSLRWHQAPASSGASKGVVLLFHGNFGGAAERFEYARRLCPLGWEVALAEYPGYAGDASACGEWPLLRNALAMYDEILERGQGRPVVLLGESLGTAAATFVAFKRAPRGLILHTPYPSMTEVAQARYPWLPIARLIRHPLRADLWAPHVRCPVLVLHGSADRTVPYRLGQKQAARFRSPLRFVTIAGAGHSDLCDFDPPAYWGALARFLEELA